jgi:hypothetical protein
MRRDRPQVQNPPFYILILSLTIHRYAQGLDANVHCRAGTTGMSSSYGKKFNVQDYPG